MGAPEIAIRVPRRAPPLESTATTRLLLEPLAASHRAEVERLHSDPRVMKTLGGLKSASETEEILRVNELHWETHGFGLWALRLRADGRFVGRGGIRHTLLEDRDAVELAYALDADHWGRGLATELAEAGLCAGFEGLGLAEIVAFTLPHNRASRGVMEKSGFVQGRDVMHWGLPHVFYRLAAADRGEPHYLVRLAREEEIPALGAIERAASALFAGSDLADGVSADVTTEADFRDASSREALWVAIGPGGRPVGFALVDEEDDCAHLDELDVHPAHGRRGLGAALVRAACEGALRQRFPAVTLTTFRELPWNAPFYRRLGFRALEPAEYGPDLTELVAKEDAAGLSARERVVMRLDL